MAGIPTFEPFPKIPRLSNEHMTIQEKLDGSNASIWIDEDAELWAASRARWLINGQDNYGFNAWCQENKDTLIRDLGIGMHRGEWWGRGIQRNYGMDHRIFSLFNTFRWAAKRGHFLTPDLDVVPVLWEGPFDTTVIDYVHQELMDNGSQAARGWDKPEGVVVWLDQARTSYKLTDHAAGPSKPRTTS